MNRKMSTDSERSPIALKYERKKALATARQAARTARLADNGIVKISHLVRVEDVAAAREAMAPFTVALSDSKTAADEIKFTTPQPTQAAKIVRP